MVVVGRWSVGRVGSGHVARRSVGLLSELWSRPIDWSRFIHFGGGSISAIDGQLFDRRSNRLLSGLLGYYGCEELGSE